MLLPLVLCSAAPASAEDAAQHLDPLPPMVLFPLPRHEKRIDDKSPHAAIAKEVARAFASLGDVQRARRLFVHRYGLLSVKHLVDEGLQKRDAYAWNASLTLAALRDTYGNAPELHPALQHLAKLLTPRGDFHTPAFAALAFGSFHWTQARIPERYRAKEGYYVAVPGPRTDLARAARAIDQAREAMLRRVDDARAFMRIAATLGLAKMGGPKVRAGLLGRAPPEFFPVEQQQAVLLAGALLKDDDPKAYRKALEAHETKVRAAGALAIAVAVLVENAPAWTRNAASLQKRLRAPKLKQPQDLAEAVFARGVLALRAEDAGEAWERLWTLATTPSEERVVAEAAAQCLLFCDLPSFNARAIEWAGGARVQLKNAVRGMVLLRAGMAGSQDGLDACEKWLRNKAQRPEPDDRWDPRWYAAIGLMRALRHGRIKVRERRQRIIETLRRAVDRVLDKKAPVRGALDAVLQVHGDRIASAEESSLYLLPESALRQLEASFRCPHALLSADIEDVCVHRLNAMVHLVFGLDGIREAQQGQPNTEKQPEKYLKRYLEDFPYFSRLDLLDERGVRPPQGYAPDTPMVIDK